MFLIIFFFGFSSSNNEPIKFDTISFSCSSVSSSANNEDIKSYTNSFLSTFSDEDEDFESKSLFSNPELDFESESELLLSKSDIKLIMIYY